MIPVEWRRNRGTTAVFYPETNPRFCEHSYTIIVYEYTIAYIISAAWNEPSKWKRP